MVLIPKRKQRLLRGLLIENRISLKLTFKKTKRILRNVSISVALGSFPLRPFRVCRCLPGGLKPGDLVLDVPGRHNF